MGPLDVQGQDFSGYHPGLRIKVYVLNFFMNTTLPFKIAVWLNLPESQEDRVEMINRVCESVNAFAVKLTIAGLLALKIVNLSPPPVEEFHFTDPPVSPVGEVHFTGRSVSPVEEVHFTDPPVSPVGEFHFTDPPVSSVEEPPLTEFPVRPVRAPRGSGRPPPGRFDPDAYGCGY